QPHARVRHHPAGHDPGRRAARPHPQPGGPGRRLRGFAGRRRADRLAHGAADGRRAGAPGGSPRARGHGRLTPLTIAAVGDVFVDRPEPAAALGGIAPLLEASDVTFANFEGVVTDRHAPVPGASDASIVPPAQAEPLRVFDVLSLANNHALDAGHGGLADTIAALDGAAVVGA